MKQLNGAARLAAPATDRDEAAARGHPAGDGFTDTPATAHKKSGMH
jgi:hypothetical protein